MPQAYPDQPASPPSRPLPLRFLLGAFLSLSSLASLPPLASDLRDPASLTRGLLLLGSESRRSHPSRPAAARRLGGATASSARPATGSAPLGEVGSTSTPASAAAAASSSSSARRARSSSAMAGGSAARGSIGAEATS